MYCFFSGVQISCDIEVSIDCCADDSAFAEEHDSVPDSGHTDGGCHQSFSGG